MPTENFDLNLIRVFLAVAKCRSVTGAGEQLGLTQSSVSHALARLRTQCQDRLFVTTPQGMMPTAAALEMIEPLAQALELATRALRGGAGFDPSASERRFKLVLSEIGELSYLPLLLERLSIVAPKLTLRVLHLAMGEHYDALLRGEADLTIGTFAADKPGFHAQHLFDQPYVCMMRADHPAIGETLSLEQYFEASHVTVDPPGRGPGIIERRLEAMGRVRKIVLQLPHFLAAPLILKRTDCLMTVPQRTWRVLGSPADIRCLPLPFDADRITARSVWHERSNGDPGHAWLRETVHRLLTGPEFRCPAG